MRDQAELGFGKVTGDAATLDNALRGEVLTEGGDPGLKPFRDSIRIAAMPIQQLQQLSQQPEMTARLSEEAREIMGRRLAESTGQ